MLYPLSYGGLNSNRSCEIYQRYVSFIPARLKFGLILYPNGINKARTKYFRLTDLILFNNQFLARIDFASFIQPVQRKEPVQAHVVFFGDQKRTVTGLDPVCFLAG